MLLNTSPVCLYPLLLLTWPTVDGDDVARDAVGLLQVVTAPHCPTVSMAFRSRKNLVELLHVA